MPVKNFILLQPLLSCLFSFENDLSMTYLKASLLFLLIVLIYPFFVFIQQLFVNFAVILRLAAVCKFCGNTPTGDG